MTDKRAAETTFKPIDRRTELILNAAADGIVVFDGNGNIAFVNSAAASMFGWVDGEPAGEDTLDIPLPEILAGGAAVNCDNELFRKKDGTYFPVEYTAAPIREEGGLAGAILVFRDITGRKNADALRESLVQLSRKNRYEAIIGSVTRSVHQSIDLQEVLDNAVSSMSDNIDTLQRVEIFLVEGNEAVLRAHKRMPDWFYQRVKRLPYGRGSTWKTIIEGKSNYVADTDHDSAIGLAGRQIGTKSYISMPIFSDGKAVGALNITSENKNAFDAEEQKLLEIVARQIETAINNARQADALKQALTEVERLKNQLHAENVYLQEEIKVGHNFEEIIGESTSLKKILAQVGKVAPAESTVLIQGETGTGKELIARAIHENSRRRQRPLVKINCGAISAGLVESELFGHEKGAFTGAIEQRIGRFELANGGTIFLDEVSELPLDTQVKLLRVLQEGEFERVGSSKTIEVDVRIIAASNKSLKELVKSGSFRADLFYRLSVFPLQVPPLRERKSDIPILASFFLTKFSKDFGRKIEGFSQGTIDRLTAYPWPGNIRELQNVVERAVVLAQGPEIEIDESVLMPDDELRSTNPRLLDDMERGHIISVLEEAGWVIDGGKGAAALLGLNPSTLRFRMKKLGISRPERKT